MTFPQSKAEICQTWWQVILSNLTELVMSPKQDICLPWEVGDGAPIVKVGVE